MVSHTIIGSVGESDSLAELILSAGIMQPLRVSQETLAIWFVHYLKNIKESSDKAGTFPESGRVPVF